MVDMIQNDIHARPSIEAVTFVTVVTADCVIDGPF